MLLPGVDHINACKPILREDASYAETVKFIQRIIDGLHADAQLRLEVLEGA